MKFDDISFSFKLDKNPKFETLNNINNDVFSYDKKYNIFLLKISKQNYETNIDLLLITNDNNNHYLLDKKL